jgi:hypothetical protein
LHRITKDFVIQLVKWNAYGRVCWRSVGFRNSAQRCLSAGAYIKGYSQQRACEFMLLDDSTPHATLALMGPPACSLPVPCRRLR